MTKKGLVFLFSLMICNAERILFEGEPFFRNQLLDHSKLGPPFSAVSILECSHRCISDTRCSLYSADRTSGTCQLFDDVLYPDVYHHHESFGLMFYIFTEDWCPLSQGYVMLRESRLCVKVHLEGKKYTEAVLECQAERGRTIVLEEEDKASVLRTVLDERGYTDIRLYIGLVEESPGLLVWEDGRNLTLDWWRPGEPDEGVEDCTILRHGSFSDVSCHRLLGFICEVPAFD